MRLQTLSLAFLLQRLQTFICEHEAGEVAGVGVRGLQNGSELVLQTVREKVEEERKQC